MPYSVALFNSTSGALRAEKLLNKRGIAIKLIPVPRQLSSDCGVCLRFERSDEGRAMNILEQAALEIQGVHPI